MKKLFLFIICAVLSIEARAQFSGSGNGTEADPYRIYTDIHLAQMANFLNQEGVVFELMKDVDLSSYISENSPSQGWTPIGVASTPFKGVLKGNNHTISGLYINRASIDNVGLFGYIDGATIQDFEITASNITGKDGVGTFVGYSKSSTLQNITVTTSGFVKGDNNVGGVIGYANASTIETIAFSTTQVEGTSYVGGVTGYVVGGNLNNARFSAKQVKGSSYIGGVVGYASNTIIKECDATSNVEAISDFIGGIVGYLSASTVTKAKITGNVSGGASVGGGFGKIEGTNTLNDVATIGDITGSANVSGIAGELITSSIVTFASCHSKGKITNGGDYTGGIVGKSNGVCINSMDDCSHFGDIKGKNYVGGLVGAVLKIDAAEPSLNSYQICSGSSSSSSVYASFSDKIVTGGTATRNIYNCTAIGNIEGDDYVGGLVGESLYATTYTISTGTYTFTSTLYSSRYLWKNGVYTPGNSKSYDRYNGTIYYWDFTYLIYTKGVSTISLINSYYSGNISATKYVGGLIGHKVSGDIQNCYTHSTINGNQHVGGIAGFIEGYSSTQHAVVKSSVANNASVTASAANVGRIYGTAGENITIGALASAEGNRALTQTKVMLCGVAQDVTDDEQNGTSVGPSMLRLKANYVSWGWNFDDNWNILETECYPFKKYQAAPPVIKSTLQSQDTSVSGQSLNGGTVYMFYKDRDAVSTECDGNNWAFTTEALQSGAQVQLYADVDGMTPSYLTSATVKYPGSGTEDDPYRIYTAEDLQGATNSGYYKLMNDIDLTSWINENSPVTGWPAIGRNSTVATYINGDGHKVTGLWTNTTAGYNGLFSNYSAGYIKNLNVEVASGKKVKGGDYTGILIGRMANGQIINCSVKGDVEGTVHVGGVSGYVTNSTVSNTTFEGKVYTAVANAFAGGVSGLADNVESTSCRVSATVTTTGEGSCVGGLYGKTNNGSVTKSTADAKITASGTGNYVGGLVGRTTSPITLCYSTGTVTASGNDSYTGGLVGYAEASIVNSYSTANVNGTQYTAGLVGYTLSTVDKCYASGNIAGVMYGAGLVGELDGANASATNSIAANNKLELSAQSSWGCRVIGGFKNGCTEPNNSNYALNTMQVSLNNVPQKKTDDAIEGIAKTLSELQSSATYLGIGWNLSKDWSIDENSTYPFLLWEVDVNPIVDITLDKTSLIIPVGNTATITASVLPLSATNKRVEWKSSKESVATVEGGIVTAVGQGTAVITATTTDGSNLSATCNVTVVANHDDAIAELNTLVDKALTLYNNSSEGDNIGQYAIGARAALLKVINEVRAQISNTMDEAAISECTTKINDAITLFQSKKVSAGEDTDVTAYDNLAYIKNKEVRSGGQAEISLELKNSFDATGYQLEIELPEGFSIPQNEDDEYLVELSSARTTAKRHNIFEVTKLNSGNIQIICSSTKNYTFLTGDGEVAVLTLNVDNSVEDGEYPIIIRNVAISDVNSQVTRVPYAKFSITVASCTPGDANTDGYIDVGDITAIVGHIQENDPANFSEAAADVNEDGFIDVGDITGVVNLIIQNANTTSTRAYAKRKVATKVDEYENIIYANPATIASGGRKTVSVCMNNNRAIAGFQFEIKLPEGLNIAQEDGEYLVGLSTARTTYSNHNIFEVTKLTNGNIQVICSTTKYGVAFKGNEGEVITFELEADADIADGQYDIQFVDVRMSGLDAVVDHVGNITSTVIVGEEHDDYAEGYALDVTPFEFNEDIEMPILLDNADDITDVEFDLMLPQAFIDNELHYIDAKLAKTKFTTSTEDINGGVHVSIARRSSNKVAAGENSEIAVLGLVFDDVLTDGLFNVEVKNIVATTTEGDEVKVAPYKASILVGNPTIAGDVKLYGNYSNADALEVVNKVAANVGVTSVDISDITAIDMMTTITTGNANAMFYLPEGLTIANEQNVVAGSRCANLVLTDGYDFSAPKAFTATSASYERSLAAEWGTVMLPYGVSSSSDVQYYALTAADLENGVLTFEEMANVAANTPAVYKATGSTLSANSANVEIPVCVSPAVGDAVAGLTLTGSLAKTTLNDLDPAASTGIYYIKDNKFWRGNGTLTIPAFRAYFDAAVAGAKMMSILGEAATGINAVVNDSESKICTIDGKPIFGNVKNLPAGMYIINDKKVVIKK